MIVFVYSQLTLCNQVPDCSRTAQALFKHCSMPLVFTMRNSCHFQIYFTENFMDFRAPIEALLRACELVSCVTSLGGSKGSGGCRWGKAFTALAAKHRPEIFCHQQPAEAEKKIWETSHYACRRLALLNITLTAAIRSIHITQWPPIRSASGKATRSRNRRRRS